MSLNIEGAVTMYFQYYQSFLIKITVLFINWKIMSVNNLIHKKAFFVNIEVSPYEKIFCLLNQNICFNFNEVLFF